MTAARLSRRLQRKLLSLAVALIVAGGLALGQQLGWFKQPAKTATLKQPGLYTVKQFVDGDTIASTWEVEKKKFV